MQFQEFKIFLMTESLFCWPNQMEIMQPIGISYRKLCRRFRDWKFLVLVSPHSASGLPGLALHAGLPTFIAPRYSKKLLSNFYPILFK
jgi:hypothetical protein